MDKMELKEKLCDSVREANIADLPESERAAAFKQVYDQFKSAHQDDFASLEAMNSELSMDDLDKVAGGSFLKDISEDILQDFGDLGKNVLDVAGLILDEL